MRQLLAALVLWAGTSTFVLAQDCSETLAQIGEPAYSYEKQDARRLCRLGYVLSHNSANKTPDWVVELLVPDRFKGPGDRKKQGNPFKADPDLGALERAELLDYEGSAYDRGHMAPAASMMFSIKATEESFYLSNIAPQIGIGLNRHIWADLERLTRHWTCERGRVVVITGPINESAKVLEIGEGKVRVPTSFYKIVYDVNKNDAIGFILPNRKISKNGNSSWERLRDFIVPISEIERLTEIDFLTALPRRTQERLEKAKPIMWADPGQCK